MAKTGTLAVSSGHASQTANNASVIEKVAPPRPSTGTLGAVVKNSLAGLSALGLVIIDFALRKVGVGTRDATFFGILDTQIKALSGDWFEFVPADAAKSSSGWTVKKNGTTIGQTLTGTAPTGLGLELTNALGYSAPSRSLESLVNAIEDALIEAGLEGVAVIDQVAEKVVLGVCEDLSAEWNDAAVAAFGSLSSPVSYPLTVQTDTFQATGVPNGVYIIAGGSSDGFEATIAGGTSDVSLGTEADEIALNGTVNVDESAKKVAVISQTVLAVDAAGTGMFQS